MSAGVISTPGGLSNVIFHGFFWDSGNNATARTFSNVGLGNPASDRYIFTQTVTTANATVPTVTIAGQSTTNELGNVWDAAAHGGIALMNHIIEDLDDDITSGDVIVNPNTTSNGVGIGVWSLRRSSRLAVDYSANQWHDSVPGTNPTCDTTENGIILGMVASNGATGVGENYLTDFDITYFDNFYSSNLDINVWGGGKYIDVDNASYAPDNTNCTGPHFVWNTFSFSVDV